MYSYTVVDLVSTHYSVARVGMLHSAAISAAISAHCTPAFLLPSGIVKMKWL